MKNHNSKSLIEVGSEYQADVPQPALNQSAAFVGNFRCIGGACSDTCCSGWNVSIDKETHYRYKKSAKPEISEIAKSSKKDEIKANFPFLHHKEQREWWLPFHDKLRLVQSSTEMGDKPYPKLAIHIRIITRCGEETYISASLSCPEAARLCLENEHQQT